MVWAYEVHGLQVKWPDRSLMESLFRQFEKWSHKQREGFDHLVGARRIIQALASRMAGTNWVTLKFLRLLLLFIYLFFGDMFRWKLLRSAVLQELTNSMLTMWEQSKNKGLWGSLPKQLTRPFSATPRVCSRTYFIVAESSNGPHHRLCERNVSQLCSPRGLLKLTR
jgi:hypothetical protein